jgi:predicted transcriptional regulator
MSEIKLPDAEMEVFACLAHLEQATAREIREAMQDYRPMAHGSVLTLLKRLEAKKLVSKEKGSVGKAFVYRTTRALNDTSRTMVQNLVRRVFGGDAVALVASLFETRPPDRGQLQQLRDLLDRLDEKQNVQGDQP